jgi:ABC-2 type transport system permease protein
MTPQPSIVLVSASITRGGIAAAAIREWRRIAASPYLMLLLVVFPIASGALMVHIFGSGAARDVPITVVDLDRSPLSRQLISAIDVTGGVRVASVESDPDEARRTVMNGGQYGLVSIPPNFERDVARGAAPVVTGFYNAQYLLPASLMRSALASSTAALSGRVELGRRLAAREPRAAALARVEPVTLDVHTLFNPHLNYITYLATALLPALLQIFIVTMTVHAFGSELRDRAAGEWLATAGGSAWRAAAGKAAVYMVHFTALAFLMLGALYVRAGVPFRGSLPVVAFATVLFVAAYVALGFAFAAAAGDLRLATSIAAFYTAPAFAFAGVTFPVEAMPTAGQAWAGLLPLTHYLRILVQQGMRGAPPAVSWPGLGALAAFALAPWPFLLWRMGRLARAASQERPR